MPKLWRMSIIDPFEYTHDLGVVLSESGMAALMRELRRAAHVLSPTQPEVKSQTNTLGKWFANESGEMFWRRFGDGNGLSWADLCWPRGLPRGRRRCTRWSWRA